MMDEMDLLVELHTLKLEPSYEPTPQEWTFYDEWARSEGSDFNRKHSLPN